MMMILLLYSGSGILLSESGFQVIVWTNLYLYQEMRNLCFLRKYSEIFTSRIIQVNVLHLGFSERHDERTKLQFKFSLLFKERTVFFHKHEMSAVCFMLCLQHQQPLSETYCKDFSLKYQPLANHWPLLWVSDLILSPLQTLLDQITVVQCLLQVVWHLPHSRWDLRFYPPLLQEDDWSIAAWLAAEFCQAVIPCNL